MSLLLVWEIIEKHKEAPGLVLQNDRLAARKRPFWVRSLKRAALA